MVESIMTYLSPESFGSTWKILSQIPDLAQRVKRLWAIFQLPYCRGGLPNEHHRAGPKERH